MTDNRKQVILGCRDEACPVSHRLIEYLNRMNMYKIYLKQAWALIRQERLFSSVYIVGTGLAISLVMVLSIVFYVKMASYYRRWTGTGC